MRPISSSKSRRWCQGGSTGPCNAEWISPETGLSNALCDIAGSGYIEHERVYQAQDRADHAVEHVRQGPKRIDYPAGEANTGGAGE